MGGGSETEEEEEEERGWRKRDGERRRRGGEEERRRGEEEVWQTDQKLDSGYRASTGTGGASEPGFSPPPIDSLLQD